MAGERYRCTACGADLVYQPGQTALACPYCGAKQEIAAPETTLHEQDFRAALQKARQETPKLERQEVTCAGCGAQVALRADVQSDRCPYCATQLTAEAHGATALQPAGILPFAVPRQAAREVFHRWLKSRWFAPGSLKHLVGWEEALQGVYVPYWTYDTHTTTAYTGQRGEDYWATETYTAHVNGKSVTRTRTVRKTRWYPASGMVENRFDDVLVLATRSLPYELAVELEPWDLKALAPFDERYVQGFRAERYQIDLEEGFGIAAGRMRPQIDATVRRDIGGDHQRVHSLDIDYHEITFKHLLLPVWVSCYRHGQKSYRIMVNAVTGEVQGQRPYSAIKIALAVAAGLAAVAAAVLVLSRLAG